MPAPPGAQRTGIPGPVRTCRQAFLLPLGFNTSPFPPAASQLGNPGSHSMQLPWYFGDMGSLGNRRVLVQVFAYIISLWKCPPSQIHGPFFTYTNPLITLVTRWPLEHSFFSSVTLCSFFKEMIYLFIYFI